jgi:hypothetical protein
MRHFAGRGFNKEENGVDFYRRAGKFFAQNFKQRARGVTAGACAG